VRLASISPFAASAATSCYCFGCLLGEEQSSAQREAYKNTRGALHEMAVAHDGRPAQSPAAALPLDSYNTVNELDIRRSLGFL
jgi:hypothetical protein